MITALAVVLTVVFYLWRRKPPSLEDLFNSYPDLTSDEREVIRYIFEKGGTAFETEIWERFDLPRTSLWRMVKRLEDRGIVVVKKVGFQNKVELKQ